ncbi:bifunctional adenosylcobinamide kinase/adenosylcobinamide-phosphate guanylyltransferase [Chengkuizengella sediminis]|uniref:bifunctional adenosylcobinamide kinase/adenosylcobinamide-phosphate guanylyltransferase n=1 Tax=Chengkuizengella sediminis TaxID=1885917 RepID=UPI001389EE76|nr:bifunctional adenosylcobinamide kinase/adenosylcobinamide-phosphate guanylyltransferase [Chengkuizengella sediminis]NDI35805.1 bifunctional adenosylcobinamide kinase/adenosylcobinamide-phosphate guanylyltransferase [Chengkuizengella sediminis]
MIILVTGGARSGKSSFAEKYSASFGDHGTYIATSQIYDEEMRDRVELHKTRREQTDFSWKTIEEPFDLDDCFKSMSKSDQKLVLVDCLTLWLSNWLLCFEESKLNVQQKVIGKIEMLISSLKQFQGTVILVTNEVGDGIVPEYPLGRLYRDLAGVMNQKIAEICDQVFLVTVGIPVELKSKQFLY